LFRRHVYWLLFLSSYSPLLLIIAIRSWGNWFVSLPVGLIGLASAASLWAALQTARGLNPEPYQVEEVRSRSSEVTGYVSSYIIPFVLVDFHNWRDIVALALLFFVVGHMSVFSEHVTLAGP